MHITLSREKLFEGWYLSLVYLLIMVCGTTFGGTKEGLWRDVSQRAVLENDATQAKFQAGLLYELKDRVTIRVLACSIRGCQSQ